MKVVLDTNVIISGLLWKKNIEPLFDLVNNHTITICLTPRIIKEIAKVLDYPKINKKLNSVGLTKTEIIKYLSQISDFFPDINLEVELDDSSDRVFLGAAVSSKAEYIITGDKHLLSLKKFQGIKIIKPQQFLKEYPF